MAGNASEIHRLIGFAPERARFRPFKRGSRLGWHPAPLSPQKAA